VGANHPWGELAKWQKVEMPGQHMWHALICYCVNINNGKYRDISKISDIFDIFDIYRIFSIFSFYGIGLGDVN